jgi:hypothetical protein
MRIVSIEQYLSEMKTKNKRRYNYTIALGGPPSGLAINIYSESLTDPKEPAKMAFSGPLFKEPGHNMDLYSVSFAKAETKVLVEFFM